MNENDLRLELKVKNARLWHVVFDEYPTVAAFCRANRFHQTAIGKLLSFKISPYWSGMRHGKPTKRTGHPIKLALAICEVSGLSMEELFPAHLYARKMPALLVAEMSSERFLPLSAARRLLVAQNLDAGLEQAELSAAMREVMDTLTPREEAVIAARFGVNGEPEQTLEEVGDRLGVGQERVRQIEAKAMRKLRHPSRCRSLRRFLEVMP